ncbi:MAG TPA: AAA family ATPase [Nocardioidaceae bacterium]|nr:AAA family ATPase [Nocardioidaceae bacterium]
MPTAFRNAMAAAASRRDGGVTMSRLIHLNGPPGIGKSTLARRYAVDHPGVLDCDIDVLRSLVGGWEDDFAAVGEAIRPAALAMISAYLAQGRDVVLPQMLARLDELVRFETAATEVGAAYVGVLLIDSGHDPVGRFHRRGGGALGTDEAWHRHVRDVVASAGGDDALRASVAALEAMREHRPDVTVVASVEGDVEQTYADVLAVLAAGRE